MKLPKVYSIINVDESEDPYGLLQTQFEFGISFIQLRAKKVGPDHIGKVLAKMLSIRDEVSPNTKLLLNDDPRLAFEYGADGVHLGQADGCPVEARELLGPGAIIGLSTHNEAQVRTAPFEALSYVAVGPIFHSETKSGHAPELGLEGLSSMAKACPLPVVAIGGIGPHNIRQVLSNGADCAAMISAVGSREALSSIIATLRGEVVP